jgi:hypothetical protein
MERQFQLSFNERVICARVLSGPDYLSLDLTDPQRRLDTIFVAVKTPYEPMPTAVPI